jgi:predicted esterase
MADAVIWPPHSSTQTLRFSPPPNEASHAIILLHGRGSTPSEFAPQFFETFLSPETEHKICVVVPAAEDRVWYPTTFNRDWSVNEPWLSAAVERVEREVQGLERGGIPRERIMIGGFSQGACISAKFILTYPNKYWGVFLLSGAIPGPFAHEVNNLSGLEKLADKDLRGTRVFVGCGESDRHIPAKAAKWTAWVLRRAKANVDERIYEGMGHVISTDELAVLKSWAQEVTT